MNIFGNLASATYTLTLERPAGFVVVLIDRSVGDAARGVAIELEKEVPDMAELRLLAFMRARAALRRKRVVRPDNLEEILAASEIAEGEMQTNRCIEVCRKYTLPLFRLKNTEGGTAVAYAKGLYNPLLTPNEETLFRS